MSYGMYLSASGARTAMHRMDVASNNLSNLGVTAFKPDIAFVRQRDVASIEKNLPFLPSNELLERLGGGVLAAPTRTDFSPGPPQPTSNPLDAALLTEGFFVVRDATAGNDAQIRLSRDGRFTVSADGRLVQASSGLPVLDPFDREIRLARDATASISPSGEVLQAGLVMGQIQVTGVADTDALVKVGEGLFQSRSGRDEGRRPVDFLLQPRAVEGSGVEPIKWMMQMTRASGAAQRNMRMIQIQDEMMGRAISSFARIG